jgi:hypothetical protein
VKQAGSVKARRAKAIERGNEFCELFVVVFRSASCPIRALPRLNDVEGNCWPFNVRTRSFPSGTADGQAAGSVGLRAEGVHPRKRAISRVTRSCSGPLLLISGGLERDVSGGIA